MSLGRGRAVVGILAAGVALLFAGRWVAMFLADRWWAETVAPGAASFLTRWHLLGLALEVGGIVVAGAWCVGHFLWVVGSIGGVQVPRRLGDLEIRELVPLDGLRVGAVVGGLLLGFVVGSGGTSATPLVMQAWHGVRFGVTDPALGLDIGVYLVQLPIWDAGLQFARYLVWIALGVAALSHFAVGGLRVSPQGLAMTDAARVQVGLLVAMTLLLAALGQALGPLRAVAGLDTGPWNGLAPTLRWVITGAWAGSAAVLVWWAVHPSPRRFLAATILWGVPLLLGTIMAATLGNAAPTAALGSGSLGARASGADRVIETVLPANGKIERVEPGLWERSMLPALVSERPGTRILAAAPVRLPIGDASLPVWLVLRADSGGRALVVIADDRLGPGGSAVTFRDGDPIGYPGVVTWRELTAVAVAPEAADTVIQGVSTALPIGGTWRRVAIAWGTQSSAALGVRSADASLSWRRAPHDRVRHLFPPAWWDEPRPLLRNGQLWWIVDGWFTAEGAPLAPAIPWEGGVARYARPGLIAVVDAEGGAVSIYRRPDADAIVSAWAEIADGLLQPSESIPSGLLEASPSGRALSVVSRALQPGAELPRATLVWGPRGPVPQFAFSGEGAQGGGPDRVSGVLYGAAEEGYLMVRWPDGTAPLAPRVLNTRWGRFASLERLEDSVRSAGGRLEAGAVRYDLTTSATLAVRNRWAISAAGAPSVAWVEVGQGDRLGAARTPATALTNLHGESAPVVPAPDLPDALSEARRWTARADSALRAGDLQAFGRAFEALKRVLGTP